MMKKVLLLAAIIMMILLVSPARIFAQASDPASIVTAFNAAVLDPAAQMGMITDDVVIKIVPPPAGSPGVWTGKAEAQNFFAFVKGKNVHRDLVGSWQVTGDTVTGTVMVTNSDFAAWNVGAVQHQLDFVVQDGKIKSFITTMAPSERPRVMAAAQAFAAAHGGPAPTGMPQTGAGDPVELLLPSLLLAALGLVSAGFTVRRVVVRRS
jgi:hypothetical protein